MSLSVSSSIKAMAPGLSCFFLGTGGTGPYTYAVLPGGAGGTINSSTGEYTAPPTANPNPNLDYDTIQVTDSLSATATTEIVISTPLELFCEILQRELGLADGRVYMWDQKINQPKDSDLYIAVGIVSSRPFGNTFRPDGSGGGLDAVQSINVLDQLSIDIISRGPQARDRKEEVLMALNSAYAHQQQEFNSFKIGQLPAGSRFVNLSEGDGAAIPYRFRIEINLQYSVKKTKAIPYLDDFSDAEVTTES